MNALYITLHTDRKLLVFPDTIAHLNGHAIITKGYAIFKDLGVNTAASLESKQSEELLEPIDDPDYLGRLQSESAHMIMWLMSDRAIPRSLRMIEGFGVHTFRLINAGEKSSFHALIKAGGFDEAFEMAWREDSDLHFKFIRNNVPIKRVETARVVHPVRASTWGMSVKDQKKIWYNALIYKKHPELYDQLIRQKTPVLYYSIIAAFVMMLAGLFLHQSAWSAVGFAGWAGLTCWFIFKRLRYTRLILGHGLEMVCTSVIIPFASVFWQWYGAVKYRVLFI